MFSNYPCFVSMFSMLCCSSSRVTIRLTAQCWVQDLARGDELYQVFTGQTSRCFIVCSSPHAHAVCPSSLNPPFCILAWHRRVPVRRRFGLDDQVGQSPLEPGGSDSLGLNETLCGVVWRWLAQRVSLRVRVLP